jgi:hypothetical protein
MRCGAVIHLMIVLAFPERLSWNCPIGALDATTHTLLEKLPVAGATIRGKGGSWKH